MTICQGLEMIFLNFFLVDFGMEGAAPPGKFCQGDFIFFISAHHCKTRSICCFGVSSLIIF